MGNRRHYDEVEEYIKNVVEARGLDEFLYDHDLEPWEAAFLLYDHGLIDVDPEDDLEDDEGG